MPPAWRLAVAGVTEIEVTVCTVTLIVAVAVFVGSAKLVTAMVAVPGVAGAVNRPAELIEPELVAHAMDLLEALPYTAAVN